MTATDAPGAAPPARLLRRACACGTAPGLKGECEKCAAGTAAESERSFSEPRFGHDFSRVQLYAAALWAHSTTAGGETGAGQSSPGSPDPETQGPGVADSGGGVEDCQIIPKMFSALRKGSVHVYKSGNEFFVQAGMSRGGESENQAGVNYIAGAALEPPGCAELEFVQNVESNRVITFKDASKLELITGQMLDGQDPYKTDPVGTFKGNVKVVGMNDSPSQGTAKVFGLIDDIYIKDSFKLFLRAKSGGVSRIIAKADWVWEAKAVTTNSEDKNAPLTLESGTISAPDGKATDGVDAPVYSPVIQEQSFKKAAGGPKSYAAQFEKYFSHSKKHQEGSPSPAPVGVAESAGAQEETQEETQAPCKPTLNFLKAEKTGPITMRAASAGGCELSFGVPGSPGMTFRAEVEAPAGCTGRLEYLQLIDTRRQRRDAEGADECMRSDGFVLDTRDPKAGRWVTSAGTKSFESSDSPGAPTSGYVYRSAHDEFQTWLLWRPDDPPESARVPLGVVQWHWKARAEKTGASGGCAADWTISDDEAVGGTGFTTPEGAAAPAPAKNVVDLMFTDGAC